MFLSSLEESRAFQVHGRASGLQNQSFQASKEAKSCVSLVVDTALIHAPDVTVLMDIILMCEKSDENSSGACR